MSTKPNSSSSQYQIYTRLQQVFSPSSLVVHDDSHKHHGHKGALENPDKGHFHVVISAISLRNKNLLQQHRMIYQALSPLMHRIHALQITIKKDDSSL
ncbi:MAG: BolA family protein [Pseudomonadota bacterium]|nr:BolA family protein [Pseudomonadota bacterium]